jgi:hypothetical protein
MNQTVSGVITVATAIVGVAILAVLVSNRAQTSQVISSAGGAFAQAIGAAVSPLTGTGSSGLIGRPASFNLGYNEYM